MDTNKIMELVNNICLHKGDEFAHAEALLNLVPMTAQKRKQLHIWEIPYAENGFVDIYFYFGDISEPHREFCLSTGTDDNGEFVFVISEVVTKGSFSELKKLCIDYFAKSQKPMQTKKTIREGKSMKRSNTVLKMIERANEYLKSNGVRDPYKNDVFWVVTSMLMAAKTYKGFNWYEDIDGIPRLTGTDQRGYVQFY